MPESISLVYWPVLMVAAYIVGAMPFAQILARFHGIDLREVGTGNVGAGNLRSHTNWGWGVVAGLLDAAKGFLPVFIAQRMGLGPGSAGLAGVAAVVGHNWSIFMRGRSGRGLAASAGLLLALNPVLLVWVGGWSLVGLRYGGGIGGFLGWGLLPIVSATMAEPATESLLLFALAILLMGRRVQGNRDSQPGVRPAMERVVYDTDRAADPLPDASEEPLTP
jgi:acyl phosphate:glycerol-3-phosphate acyltransferase